MNNFYVYVHKKASNGEIFYVGKGKDSRYKTTFNRSTHWKNVAQKHGVKFEILFSYISEDEAFEAEEFLIKEIGRLDLKTGKLVNKTNGGEGQSGRIQSNLEKEKRAISLLGNKSRTGQKISFSEIEKRAAALRGKPRPDDVRKKISIAHTGKKLSDDRKLHLRNINLGKKHSKETKIKMSESRSGKRNPKFDSNIYFFENEKGLEFKGFQSEFIKKFNLNQGLVGMVIRGQRSHTAGWHLKGISNE